MTANKTKSGKWRTQVYLGERNGKQIRVSVTADTKRQCLDKAALLKAKGLPDAPAKPGEKLGECIDRYIDSSETLSPTTLAGYRKIRRTMFQDIMDLPVEAITSERLQKAINAEMRRKSRRGHNISAKSIRNAYGLVSASLKAFYGQSPRVKLPEKDPKFLELPEVDFILAKIVGSDIELPCMLALWLSLSMSEVRGLKYSSIRNGCIYIDQVVVDVDGHPVEKKRAKVASRNRVLACPDYIMQLIRKTTDYNKYERRKIFDGYLCPFREYTIRRRLKVLLPGITFHQLRHMNASIMLAMGVPDKYAMERGGWSTPHVMKAVYQHTFSADRRKMDAKIDDYFCTKLHNFLHTSPKPIENT